MELTHRGQTATMGRKRKEHPMISPSLEKRVAQLEAELGRLRRKIEATDSAKPWWERIAGTFEKDPVYEQAMKMGREHRQSLSPARPSRRRRTSDE